VADLTHPDRPARPSEGERVRLSVEPTGRTEYGPGVLAELPDFVASLGHTRVFVVTDRGLRATGIVGRVEQILAAAGVEHAVHEDVGPNPSTAEL
jgi:alcohol dehydrogenase class IV